MFRDIRIKYYRGLQYVQLEGLGQVNVLVGDNNSGKTSVLEAIQLFSDNNVLTNLISIARKRDTPLNSLGRNKLQPFDCFYYSFPMNQDRSKEIYVNAYSDIYGECEVGVRGEIYSDYFYSNDLSQAEMRRYDSVCDEDGMISVVRGEYLFQKDKREVVDYIFRETQVRPEIMGYDNERYVLGHKKGSIMYISPMDVYTDKILSASLYRGMLVEEKHRLIDLMRLFDERIISIETAVLYGKPTTMIEMQEMGLAPISVFGDGIKKVLTLASAVIKMRGGVVLIDEFETGIHKRALKSVAEWMLAISRRYDVQIFLTTHSSDAIAALLDAQELYDNCISAYRIELYKDEFYVKHFVGRDLNALKNDRGLDII